MNSNGRGISPAGGYDRYLPALAGDSGLSGPWDLGVEEEDDGIDLRAIWAAVYRNRYLIIAVMALAMAAGVASLFLMRPIYRAEASVEIDQQPVKVLGTEDSEPLASSQEADRFLQTQVDVLKSRALASRVADSLNLAANDKFLREMHEPLAPGSSPADRREAVVNALQANLGVGVPKNSRVVPLSFDSPRPYLAATIANSYADNFIAANLQRRFDTSTYSRNFLQDQLNITKGKLEQSERALIAYARSVGLVDPSAGGGTPDNPEATGPHSLTTSNLVQLNQAYSAARSTRVQAQQRWEQARAAPVMTLPEVLSNPAIQQLTQRRAELQAEYQEELQHRKPDHPAVQQAGAALKELDTQISTLASSIRGSIRDQYLTAQRQESALSGNVSQLKGQTLSEQDKGIRYNILKREVDTNRQMYDGLLQRYKEISAQAGITSNNISIVDKAEPPDTPVSPRPLINLALAAIGGLVLALLLVFAREMLDDAVRAPDDVDHKLGLPLLGAVPRLKRKAIPQQVLLDSRSALSEAYHTIRASVDLSSGDGPPVSILVTSSRGSEGKSTSALALAKDFAAAGKRVLLIDADLRNPSLHRLFEVKRAPGLSNLLARRGKLEDVVRQIGPGLSFIAAGPQPPSPAELLAGDNFARLIHMLKEQYDHIIIDSPPVLGLADAPQMAAVVDGTIIVIEANKAHHGETKAALRRLLNARAKVLGAVLSKFDPAKAGYGAHYLESYYRYGEPKDGRSDNPTDAEGSDASIGEENELA